MINNFILKIQQMLNDNINLKEEMNNDIYTQEEKKFIWILSIICEKIHNFSPEDEHNTYLQKSLTDEVCESLKKLCDLDIPILIKGKIFDCVWINKREYESAKQAFNFYSQYMKINNEFDENFHIFMRIIGLYIKPGQRKFDQNNINESLSIILLQGKDNKNALLLRVLEACYKYSLLDIDELIKLANDRLIIFEKENITGNVIIGYYELLEQLYSKKFNVKTNSKVSKNKDISDLRRRKANYYINNAEREDYEKTNNYMKYVYMMKKAINVLKTIENTEDERKEILKKMATFQEKCVKNMHCFKQSIDISDGVKTLQNSLEKLNKEGTLYFLAYYFPIIKKSDIKSRTLKNSENSVFSQLFGREIINKVGKTVEVIPPIPKKNNKDYDKILEKNMFFNLSMEYSLYVSVGIKYVFDYINRKFEITEDDIGNLIEHSLFVPENRKVAFTKGLFAGFKGDFITSLSILIPQVENAIRIIAQECGDIIYSINQEGIEQIKTLDGILDSPKLNECLDEDYIFNLKAIFVSKYCWNMRNDFAHGLYDDDEFNSEKMLLTWWFIYKLCYQMAVEPIHNNRK